MTQWTSAALQAARSGRVCYAGRAARPSGGAAGRPGRSTVFVVESQIHRHLLVRLPRGADFFSSLRRLCTERDVSAGWVQGLGAFEWCELAEYDQHTLRYRPARRIERPLELLHLEGNVSSGQEGPFVHAHVVVSYETPEGIRVLGGHLTAARVFACELRLTAFEDIDLSRHLDPATGLSLWRETDPGVPGSEVTAKANEEDADPWSMLARVSEGSRRVEERGDTPSEASAHPTTRGRASARGGKRRRAVLREARTPAPVPQPVRRPRKASLDLDEPYPEPGDWLDHFRLGRCRVVADDPEGGMQLVLPSGARRTIHLDRLEVSLVEDGEERVFRVRRKR